MTVAAAFKQPLPGVSPDIYGPADFRAVAEIVYSVSGNVLPEGKAMLVYSRLSPLVRETGCATFANYVELIRSDPKEQARTVAALTTNHTFFYRESHHFDHFERVERPGIVRRLESGKRVRIWSAGCSSGEETWSLVLTLLGSDRLEGRRMSGRDLRVLASDIAPHALKRAEQGVYPTKDLGPVPSDLVQLWTSQEGDNTRIGDVARSIVRFRSLNLMEEWPIKGCFDVIFCRNVMIYFDAPTKERLVARFAEKLVPGGHLYIGHSERVTGPAANVLEPVGPTIYRRRMS
ncbi:protein-glutamate O-methyltransferase CheR [Novosphingobium sp. TH158]|uniref:CheR family methyltransferase n=1 Tax=Novosphingobium sp. TH158 TaxID=2067455 RepID=UPI000C7B641C|nr:CheR family methyltransferase [Novosphingobium sp. TH158]PLK26658.1 chemotaxis protein CheR [Novosphingobium sp. TH158]